MEKQFNASMINSSIIYEYVDYEYYVLDNDSALNTNVSERYILAQNIMDKTLTPIVCCGGIIGIILTMVVLSRKTMSTSTNCYLTALAVADLLFLVFLLASTLKYLYPEEEIMTVYSFYCGNLISVFNLCSIWITIMLAIERYIAICHPFKALIICSLKHAKIVIAIVYIVAIIVRIPPFFDRKIQSKNINGSMVIWSELSDLGKNNDYLMSYTWTVDFILTTFLPFVSLLILNCRLVHEIQKSTKYLRYHLAASSNVHTMIVGEERRITVMLVAIIIVFFICQGPYIAFTAYVNVYRFSGKLGVTDAIVLISSLMQLLVGLKSSFNFIVYCWFSEKFWNTFKHVICIKYCATKVAIRRPSDQAHQLNGTKISCHASTRETTNI